jgi:hypothetical protein
MLRKSGIIFVMLIAVAILVTASASAVSANNGKTTGDNGWIVTPVSTTTNSGNNAWVVTSDSSKAMSANTFTASDSGVNYIIQGQTVWCSKYIPSCSGFFVDLNWGNTANALQLTIYAPDGSILGPVYDSADTRNDGRIYLYISKQSGNVPAGTYYSQIYGYHVTGSQSYTYN